MQIAATTHFVLLGKIVVKMVNGAKRMAAQTPYDVALVKVVRSSRSGSYVPFMTIVKPRAKVLVSKTWSSGVGIVSILCIQQMLNVSYEINGALFPSC